MNDQSVSEVLDAYAPEDALDDVDWGDVLRRAQLGAPRRSHRKRVLALAAAGVVLLVLLATPAFGLRQALLDLVGREDVSFEQSEPAPPVVKRDFADLGLGAPPGMDPGAFPNQTRRVIFDTGQRKRELFVTPTKRGGFCYTLAGSGGGCQRNGGAADRTPPLTLTSSTRWKPGEPVRIQQVGGTLLDARVARVTIEFNDGAETDVRFVWISAPIHAGFFAYDLPRDRQEKARGPRSVVARAADGTILHEDGSFHYEVPGALRGALSGPSGGQILPAEPPVPPTRPLKQAADHGATVTVGANGAALFDSTRLEPRIRRLLEDHSASFGCFRVATQYGATYARGYSISGRFADRVGARFNDLGPLDGCDIQGSYGHRWPDTRGSHSAVEFAFTERGSRYFTDRAAARDLALFVRAKEVQQIRRLAPAELRRELDARYGEQIVRLTERTARPPAGKIGYWIGPERTVFSRISETGRRLYVEVENGRIARHNLEQMAKVF